jgi:hypothetical protein
LARKSSGSPGTASTDNGPGIEYEVRVNGASKEVVGGTQTVTYTEVLGANTVTIVAVAQAGSASAASNPITVFTSWGPEASVSDRYTLGRRAAELDRRLDGHRTLPTLASAWFGGAE